MSDPERPNAFDKLYARGADRQALLAREDRQYEDTCVSFLLQKLHPAGTRNQLLQQQARQDADAGRLLRFTTYNEYFPTFPFLLGCSRLRRLPLGDHKATPDDYCVHRDMASVEPSRFKNFARVPFVVAYRRFYELSAGAANGRRLALVFPRKGFLRGMVIHDDASEKYWTKGLCWVYKAGADSGTLYVQPFQALIEGIACSEA